MAKIQQQNKSANPGTTPGGDGGTKAALAGQPSSTGETAHTGPGRDTPNEMQAEKGGNMKPKK